MMKRLMIAGAVALAGFSVGVPPAGAVTVDVSVSGATVVWDQVAHTPVLQATCANGSGPEWSYTLTGGGGGGGAAVGGNTVAEPLPASVATVTVKCADPAGGEPVAPDGTAGAAVLHVVDVPVGSGIIDNGDNPGWLLIAACDTAPLTWSYTLHAGGGGGGGVTGNAVANQLLPADTATVKVKCAGTQIGGDYELGTKPATTATTNPGDVETAVTTPAATTVLDVVPASTIPADLTTAADTTGTTATRTLPAAGRDTNILAAIAAALIAAGAATIVATRRRIGSGL